MKNAGKKLMSILTAGIVMAAGITGCSNTSGENNTTSNSSAANGTTGQTQEVTAIQESSIIQENSTTESTQDTIKQISGNLTMVGSTSMEKLANAACEAFMNKYPDVVASAEFVGSGAGVEAVLNGSADIGNSSRNLKDTEKEAGAVENIVAIDGIAVIADKENTVENLTKDQLVGIYTGTITNWSEVGGEDQPIVVVGREAGSGTRGAFEEILEIADQCVYSNELDNTGAVVAKVSSTKGAIGYVSLDVIDDTVKALQLERVDAAPENIIAGTYFLSRPFVMATKGNIDAQNEVVKAWFEFLYSEEGKSLIEKVGLIPVN